MSNKSNATVATMGIDIGKNSFHVVGLDQRGAIAARAAADAARADRRDAQHLARSRARQSFRPIPPNLLLSRSGDLAHGFAIDQCSNTLSHDVTAVL